MNSKSFLEIFLFICVLFGTSSSSVFVDKVRHDLVKDLKTSWRKLLRWDKYEKNDIELLQEVGKQLANVPEIIGQLERNIINYDYGDTLKQLTDIKGTSNEWKSKWTEISILTGPIDVLYGHLKIFPKMPESFAPGGGLMDIDSNSLADMILKPMYSTDEKSTIDLRYLLEFAHLRSTVSGFSEGKEKDAFEALSDHIEEALKKNYWCLWNEKTPQMAIYGFYKSLVLSDLKEYALYNFAWMLRYAFNNTANFTRLDKATEDLETRSFEKFLAAKKTIATASSSYHKCDPAKYKEGENYDQFKELLQGYIENESNMHPKGSCRETCSDYNFVKAKCDYPTEKMCHEKRVCNGNLVNCEYITADSTVCLADTPRRYDYIDYKGGPLLGKDKKCKGEVKKKDSHWRFLLHCSNCFCLCDDPTNPTTVRKFSLVPVTSDIYANKIVTGVRFVIKDGILFLQIQEGVATNKGAILDVTTNWRELPKISKSSTDLVYEMTFTRRFLDLDDIIVPKDFVVTGVKFRQLGSHVNLEVQATQIKPTGELVYGTSHWISNDNTPESAGKRNKLDLGSDLDIPTLTNNPSEPDSVHDLYVEFGPTSKSYDVSQTTVPFIDIQEVKTSPPTWLRGIGVYHKGQKGFGGFVAPRVFTVDLSEYMSST